MVSIYELKPRFQNLLRPLTNALVRVGVTANQVTVFAMLLSLASGAWIAWQPETSAPLLAVPIVLFCRMALNAIDGMIAREHNMKSNLGTFLNELGDVVSDAGLYLPLALIPGVGTIPAITAVVLAGLTELAGVVAVQIGASRRYDGPAGKSDRAFIYGAIYLSLGLGLSPVGWMPAVLTVLNVLLAFTVINRIRKALGEVSSS